MPKRAVDMLRTEGTDMAVNVEPGALRTARQAVGQAVRRAVRRRVVRVVTVRQVAWDTVRVSHLGGVRRRRYRLAATRTGCQVQAPVLRIDVPDPTALDRIAASGLLRGQVREVRVRVGTAPVWLRRGLQPPRISRATTAVHWELTGNGLELRLGWRRRQDLGLVLREVAAALLRTRPGEQTGGPVHVLDRAGWIRESATWPLGTAVANPHGRRLFGTATPLAVSVERGRSVVVRGPDRRRLLRFDERTPVEQTLLSVRWDKYAVATLDDGVSDLADLGQHADLADRADSADSAGLPALSGRFVAHVLTSLAACGVVLASRSEAVRERLTAHGLTVVADPVKVTGLAGYHLSAAASRTALLTTDPTLRGTALAEEHRSVATALAREQHSRSVPTVSVLIASKRSDDVIACLDDLVNQTYPAFEVLVGTHGYRLNEDKKAELRDRLRGPLRVLEVPPQDSLGEVLGYLARSADGELVSKVDDDDRYGPDHLTDLFLAARASGADLVAKSARFVHLASAGQTVDRSWAAVEAFDVTPAGGTLLLSRGTLQAVGGWSTARRHVDADLLARVRADAGVTYRTHGLGYVYTRRSSGHTWEADASTLRRHGGVVYDGLPDGILATPPSDGAQPGEPR